MNISKGDVVIATAGKEKNQLFVVSSVDEKFCFLVDGKRLKIDKPKKKSLKHVQKALKNKFCQEELESEQESVNAAIRKFLKEGALYVKGRCD